MILKSFTKKGYFYGRQYLVFKVYGEYSSTLNSLCLEDKDGHIVFHMYSPKIDLKEQLLCVLNAAERDRGSMMKTIYRVFNEEGIPYEVD